MAAGREQFFLAIKKEFSKCDCECFVWKEKGEICSNEKSTFLVNWKLLYLFREIFSLEVAKHFIETTMETTWRLLFWILKNLNIYFVENFQLHWGSDICLYHQMLPISEYLQRLTDRYMFISMRWATLQSKEWKQQRRMTHKQKYQRRKILLARICIVCSYIRLFKAPFDFQINE